MTSTAKHTPTLYRDETKYIDSRLDQFWTIKEAGTNDTVIYVLDGGLQMTSERSALVDTIVRAVNHHAELVATLKAIQPYVQCGEKILVDAALAKIEAAKA